MERKQAIRKRVLSERSVLSDKERTQMSIIIQKKVMETDAYKNAEVVLLYVDYNGEVATDLLLADCFRQGKKVACPRVLADGEMEFFEIAGVQDLKEGYKGIREPGTTTVCEAESALVIVPGVAFDREGFRIGYGKGFYDRYLRKHPTYETIALAFECQIVEQIPREEHDICIGKIITEK